MVTETLKNSDQRYSFEEHYSLVWIGLGLSLVHIVLPIKTIIDKIQSKKDPKILKAKTFDEVKTDFLTVIIEINAITPRIMILRIL